MPDRIIRDELLRSHRYRTLTSDTSRLLFLHLLLSVDNLGNYEANSTAIGDVLRRPMDDSTVAKLLAELADQDLIRMYQDEGKPYLHIPRFRQRLKYLGSKHPRPPEEIECKEIKQLADEYSLKATFRRAKGRTQANEVKRREVKRSEEIQPQRARDASPVDNSSSGDQQPGTPHPVGDKSPKKKTTPAPSTATPPRPARGVQDREGIEALARYFGRWPLQGRAGQDWGEALDFVNRLRREHFGSEHA